MTLPEEFLQSTKALMGDSLYDRFMAALGEEPPVSIRLNPMKADVGCSTRCESVPWCEYGLYLAGRPKFTFDPLFHAGCYYVQEASSMFVYYVVRHILNDGSSWLVPSGVSPVRVLDLCAAPGGKSTAMLSALPEGSMLVSNEPMRPRAAVLSENMQKWGRGLEMPLNCFVTNNYARDFARQSASLQFDIILCDVPCSGEGMFRKDPEAIGEWSVQNVERCWRLQREIVDDIWPCLRPGGIMIYSTCTFNVKENEANVRWIMEHLDADIVEVPVAAEWNICGSLLPGFEEPVYRFIPGMTRGEGLFMAVLRRRGNGDMQRTQRREKAEREVAKALGRLNVVSAVDETPDGVARYELSYPMALAYLRREALVLPPEVPRGIVVVTFHGHPLGMVKNIGSRANNLYPKEWAIKTSHLPDCYEPVVGGL